MVECIFFKELRSNTESLRFESPKHTSWGSDVAERRSPRDQDPSIWRGSRNGRDRGEVREICWNFKTRTTASVHKFYLLDKNHVRTHIPHSSIANVSSLSAITRDAEAVSRLKMKQLNTLEATLKLTASSLFANENQVIPRSFPRRNARGQKPTEAGPNLEYTTDAEGRNVAAANAKAAAVLAPNNLVRYDCKTVDNLIALFCRCRGFKPGR